MFNFSKDHVENTTEHLAKKSDQAIEEIAAQVKSTANELLDAVNDTADHTQDKAKALIQHLKSNIDKLTSEEHAADLATKAGRVKDQVQREVSDTYASLKTKTADTVQEHPLGTVLVAAGVGLLIGYLLGSKRRE